MLDERKKRILQAVIDDYINTGEPVGSRTIAKSTSLVFPLQLFVMRCLTWKRWGI